MKLKTSPLSSRHFKWPNRRVREKH